MNDYCNKCGACCNNIKADKERKILYWDGIKPLTEEFKSYLVLKNNSGDTYFCRYLKNNLCTNPEKPLICKSYPSSPFVELQEGCGYYGQVFMQKENVMQKIRRLKEEITHYNAIIAESTDKKEIASVRKIIESHNKLIDKYGLYGSNDW